MRRRGNSKRRGGIVVAILAMFPSGVAWADSMALVGPSKDALVVSDPARVNENYGADPQILAWANYPVYGARSYVAFDLSGVPEGETVTFARLNLFQFLGGGYSSGLDVFRVADDAWGEDTLTWANQPVVDPVAADRIAANPALTGAERGWVSFDLLESGLWDPAVDLQPGDRRLTLMLRIPGGEVSTQRAHSFCSRDAGPYDGLLPGEVGPVAGRAPQLVIGTPEPGIAMLSTAGLLGLVTLMQLDGRGTHRGEGRGGVPTGRMQIERPRDP